MPIGTPCTLCREPTQVHFSLIQMEPVQRPGPGADVTFTIKASARWPNIPTDIDLFPHQVDAVLWLDDGEKEKRKGSLLADVMGLGKTISTTTLLCINQLPRTLIVCPKSLVPQWVREIHRIKMPVYFIEPNGARAAHIVNNRVDIQKDKIDHKDLPTPCICITTPGKVKAYPEPNHASERAMTVFECATTTSPEEYVPFRDVVWDRIVVDEVHGLRNGLKLDRRTEKSKSNVPPSLKYRRMQRLRRSNTVSMIGLTGSPIQNRISDLAAVFLFLGCPGITQKTDERVLCRLIGSHMFRRNTDNLTPLTKALISFPSTPYVDDRVSVKYQTDEEKNFYIAAAGKLEERLKVLLGGYEALVSEDNILLLLTLLRLLSSHPTSFINCYNKRYKDPIPEWTGTVSKLSMVENHLSALALSGESCIVFCHFYEEASQISELNHGYKDYGFINGSISMEERDYIISHSREVVAAGGAYLIIANIASCGEGLNCQHISNVVVYTVDWNPQAEEQAIARVHRIGQTRRVVVTRYYHEAIEKLSGTLNIDMYMKGKQDEKMALSKKLIDNTPNAAWKRPCTNIPVYDVPYLILPSAYDVFTANTKPKKRPKVSNRTRQRPTM